MLLLFVLSATPIFSQDDLPRIAVYVTGDVPDNEKKALGNRLLASLISSGRYIGFERAGSFHAEIEREQLGQHGGAIDDSQISAMGRQFGVNFVCIASVTPVLGDVQVSARIVNVETAKMDFIGEAYSHLKSVNDLVLVADRVVKNMFGEQVVPMPEPAPAPRPAQAPAPAPAPSPAQLQVSTPIFAHEPVSAPTPIPAARRQQEQEVSSGWFEFGTGVGYGIMETDDDDMTSVHIFQIAVEGSGILPINHIVAIGVGVSVNWQYEYVGIDSYGYDIHGSISANAFSIGLCPTLRLGQPEKYVSASVIMGFPIVATLYEKYTGYPTERTTVNGGDAVVRIGLSGRYNNIGGGIAFREYTSFWVSYYNKKSANVEIVPSFGIAIPRGVNPTYNFSIGLSSRI